MIDKLSCYKEISQDISGPIQIYYTEMMMQKTVEELNMIKSDLRNVTIGSIIDESGENDKSEIVEILNKYDFDSIQEYQKAVDDGGWVEDSNPFSSAPTSNTGVLSSAISGNSRTMGVKFRTLNLHPRKFNSVEEAVICMALLKMNY